MEKLKHLKVEGFRSIREMDIDLGDLTILIGANGSGKTNFISLFNMLNFMMAESLQLYIARKGYGSSILHYGPRKTPVLKVHIKFKNGNDTSDYGFSLAHAAPDRLLFTDEYVKFRRPTDDHDFERNLGVGHLETKLLDLSRNPNDKVGRKVASIFANRLKELQVYHFHDTSDEAPIRAAQEIVRTQFLKSAGGNLTAFLYMLQETKPQHFQRIVSHIKMAIPYMKGFHLEPDNINPSVILMRWQDRNPDYEFGAHQLSDGSLRIMALITALLQPEQFMPDIMLIDEPELGLHPSAINLIASLIQMVAQKRQVVVATQSPRFLAEFQPDNVVVVEREEDDKGYGHSVFRHLSSVELSDWLKEYDLGALYEMQVIGGGPQ